MFKNKLKFNHCQQFTIIKLCNDIQANLRHILNIKYLTLFNKNIEYDKVTVNLIYVGK